ncbi:hypothetical protein GCM10023215_56590 [Pseudonocardia yuanmonensis]|uniref:IclR-ED domain-containing protein n=1 Tax=Pseudonocardia yuanmonensis TaxID=1095914 RepID=A0ABP8XI60_9PSEU
MLAPLEEDQVRALHGRAGSPVADVDALLRDLRRVRGRGFAVNDQKTETGVTAIGAAISTPAADGGVAARAGLSIALPTARYRRDRLPEWVGRLTATAERISRELVDDRA